MTFRLGSFCRSVALAAILSVSGLTAGWGESENSRGTVRAARSQADNALLLSGFIGSSAYRKFASAAGPRTKLIVLHSPGGEVLPALFIASEVRRRGLDTLVRPNQICASACALIFLSGRTKYMGAGASVGLHSAFDETGKVDRDFTNIMASYLTGVGVPRSIVRRMAATGPRQMRWLTRAEQQALNIMPIE